MFKVGDIYKYYPNSSMESRNHGPHYIDLISNDYIFRGCQVKITEEYHSGRYVWIRGRFMDGPQKNREFYFTKSTLSKDDIKIRIAYNYKNKPELNDVKNSNT